MFQMMLRYLCLKHFLLRCAMPLAVLLCLTISAFPQSPSSSSYYRVEQRQGIWWFVAPDGKPFYSMGVNVVDMGASRERYNPKSPQYAAFRHYRNPREWKQTTLERLRSWNFNTLGGWSSADAPREAMPYTVVLHLGQTARVPWSDLFSEDVERRFNELARERIAPYINDKNLLGYFSDNELGWWDDTLLSFYLRQPSANRTRQVLMRLMREHYENDFARLQKDFETSGIKNFDELEQRAPLTLKLGGRGMEIVDKFTFLVAERYYKLAHDAIRLYDPHHLILGDRYHGYYPRAVARAAVPYVDVISTNYAADWTDGDISEFYLNTLHRLTGKPLLVTEFYMSATENRSGNRNSSANFPVVQTQTQRAQSFRTNATTLARLPFVVGAHWFQYYDEPTLGRGDGENYNMGLVDIHDKPYEQLTTVARALSTDKIHEHARTQNDKAKIDKVSNVASIPAATLAPERGLRGWNKNQSLVTNSESHPADWKFADFYACWDAGNLYLAIYAADYFEPRLYQGGKIPESERMTWTIHYDALKTPLRVRFGAGSPATITGAQVRLHEWKNSTRFTVLIKLPAAMFAKKTLRAGDNVPLRATLASHSRAERMEWNRDLLLTR